MKSLPLTPSQKARRDHIWIQLFEHKAPLTWDPHWIDRALNQDAPQASFQSICIGVHNRLQGSVPLCDLLYPDGKHMLAWLRQEAAWRLTPFLRDDGVGALYEIVRHAAQDFKPAGRNNRGWRTQGFLGFVLLRARRIYKWATRQSPRLAQANDSDGMVLPTIEFDLSAALIAALCKSLRCPIAWNLIYGMAYGEESLRDIARNRGIPRSTMSRNVAAPIIGKLQLSLSEYNDGMNHVVPTDISAIASALAMYLSPKEFRKMVPCPRKSSTSSPVVKHRFVRPGSEVSQKMPQSHSRGFEPSFETWREKTPALA